MTGANGRKRSKYHGLVTGEKLSRKVKLASGSALSHPRDSIPPTV